MPPPGPLEKPMSRIIALAMLLFATPLAANELDVHALYEKWKAEESRTMEGWRVLDDDTLIEKLTPLARDLNAKRSRESKREANALVGVCFRFGVGGAPQDHEMATQYLNEESPLPADVRDYLRVIVGRRLFELNGIVYMNGRLEFFQSWKTLELLRRSESDFPPDQLLFALSNFDAKGDLKSDDAAEALISSAKADCLPAMVFLSRHLTRGIEIERDANAAQAWLEKAAAEDYIPALMDLAAFHHPHDGVRPNLNRCREVLNRAAELGDSHARALLRALPEKPLSDLTVDELFQQFTTEWPKFARRKSRFGGKALCSGVSPVLTRYPDLERWLRPFADPPKLDEKTAPIAAKARCMLGLCLVEGIGGAEADRDEALSLLRSAANVGGLGAALFLYAEQALAFDKERKLMAFEDELLASWYYQAAVDTGFAPALRFQAEVSLDWTKFDYTSVFQADTEKKFRLSRDAAIAQLIALADMSDIEACRLLIQYFSTESETEHRKWVVKGANLGDPGSQLALADMYESGELPAPNPDSALTLYQRCMDSANEPKLREAAKAKLQLLALKPNVARAETLIAELEESLTQHGQFATYLADHPGVAGLAQRAFRASEETGALYGLCLLTGHGITLDLNRARRALLAAEDSPSASFLYGWLSEQEPDSTGRALRSAVWTYTAVANMGGVYAAYRLGVIHADKDSDYFSREKAYTYHSQAAEGGCIPAMVELAKAYKDGLGITADEAKAKEWAKKAADEGDGAAKALLDEWK
jgi:TPR repeat protein